MIWVDASETRTGTRMPHIDGARQSAVLEALTGADILVTNLKIPPVKATMRKHMEEGGIFIQRKSGGDLIHSMGEHLNDALYKMREWGANQSQCMLLCSGVYDVDKDGFLVLDGIVWDRKAETVWGALAKWTARGGVVHNIPSDKQIPAYLKLMEKHIAEFYDHPEKQFYPPYQLPLQWLKKCSDWRKTLATFPGLGPERVDALYNAMVEAKTSLDLFTALVWLTDTKRANKVKGQGKMLHESTRDWLGLPDGWNLELEYDESFSEKGEKNEQPITT
jgi:hypothetical protein